jgi:hypothetical protein
MQRAVAPFLVLAAATLTACGGEPGDRAAGNGQSSSPPPGAVTRTCAEGGGATPNRPGLRCGPAESPPGWTSYRSTRWGYMVSLAANWQRATSSLTPNLADPREILSLGTFPLRYRPTNCEAFAGSAQQDLGDDDAFLTIMESGIPTPEHEYPEGRIVGVPQRPRRFGPESGGGPRVTDCPGSRAMVQWINFRDAGRYFYALVAFGKSAPGELRRDAYRILDCLRFDPDLKPYWRASP